MNMCSIRISLKKLTNKSNLLLTTFNCVSILSVNPNFDANLICAKYASNRSEFALGSPVNKLFNLKQI